MVSDISLSLATNLYSIFLSARSLQRANWQYKGWIDASAFINDFVRNLPPLKTKLEFVKSSPMKSGAVFLPRKSYNSKQAEHPLYFLPLRIIVNHLLYFDQPCHSLSGSVYRCCVFASLCLCLSLCVSVVFVFVCPSVCLCERGESRPSLPLAVMETLTQTTFT